MSEVVDAKGNFSFEDIAMLLLDGVVEASNPYAKYILGSDEESRNIYKNLIKIENSEFSWIRARIGLSGKDVLGFYMAMPGEEVKSCRAIDVIRMAKYVTGFWRKDFMRRLQACKSLFNDIEHNDYYLSSIWVVPEYRNSDVGKLLMLDYLEGGKKAGFKKYRLDVASNNRSAVNLYYSMGFKEIASNRLESGDLEYIGMQLLA